MTSRERPQHPHPLPSRDGDHDYESFYCELKPWLVGRARLLVGNVEDAFDLAQDALVAAWSRWPSLRQEPLQQQRAYVYRCLVNGIYSRGRRLKVSGSKLPRLLSLDHGDSVESSVITNLEAGQAWKIILSLPAKQRAVLILTRDGWTTAEIADALGCRATSVRTHLQLARKKIKKYLEPQEGGSDERG